MAEWDHSARRAPGSRAGGFRRSGDDSRTGQTGQHQPPATERATSTGNGDTMRMVYVSWLDAQSDAEHWTTAADLEHTPRIIRTVGYDISPQIDGHVTIASSWDSEADVYGSVTHIPEVCVRELYAVHVAVGPG